MVYRLIYKKKPPFRYGSADQEPNLPPNHPAGKTVLQHRTPVISERLSKSVGFCDIQSLQLRWDDFFFGVSPLTAFHIPGKVPGTYRHRLYGLPRIPLPGHTRKIEFPTMMSTMSTYKFSLRLELVVCRDFIFLILFRRCSLSCSILSSSLPLFLLIFIRQTCQAHTSGYIQKQEIVPENDSSHT